MKATILTFASLASLLPAFADDLEKESPDFHTVYRAVVFKIGPGLDRKLSVEEQAFRRILKTPDAADQCFRLSRAQGTWLGRFYGILGLKLLHDPRYAEIIHHYFADKGQMPVSLNSRDTLTPTSVIARKIDKGEIK